MKYPVIICDDDRTLANNLANNVKYAAENLVEDNTAYENVEISVEQVATTFEQVVSYVVAKDIQNAIYFLDIELSQNSEWSRFSRIHQKTRSECSDYFCYCL